MEGLGAMPLPSRRLFCMSRVLGKVRLVRFGMHAENAREICSAIGATALAQVCAVSESRCANAAIKRQLPSPNSSKKAEPSAGKTAREGNPDVKVWVNTSSGVYHCPGTRWYGHTKAGEYLTQAQAQDEGFRPAYGKVCE